MQKEWRGLTHDEVLKARKEHGENTLKAKKKKPFLRRLYESFCDPIIRILLVALLITLFLPGGSHSYLESVGIALSILIATLVSTLSEHKNENAFQVMQEQARLQTCVVMREGKRMSIPASELVCGDLVMLTAGEIGPADGMLIDGMLSCDLSALNGESKEQKKIADPTAKVNDESAKHTKHTTGATAKGMPNTTALPLVYDKTNTNATTHAMEHATTHTMTQAMAQTTAQAMAHATAQTTTEAMTQTTAQDLGDPSALFRGVLVCSGEGVMRISAVGEKTYYGKMASEVQTDSTESPMRERLGTLAKTLSRFGYACGVLVALLNLYFAFFVNGVALSFANVFAEVVFALTLGVSVIVMAVPEGLPMMITIILSRNMMKMQKDNVTVRKPVGIETAGSLNILFTDKTGTLTYGKPTLSRYILADGKSYTSAKALPEKLAELVGATSLWASGSTFAEEQDREKEKVKESVKEKSKQPQQKATGGNGTDRAIFDGYLATRGVPFGIKSNATLSFDSKRKYMATHISVGQNKAFAEQFGQHLTLYKGAPEVLLKHATSAYDDEGKKVKINRKILSERLEEMTKGGMRVLVLMASDYPLSRFQKQVEKASLGEEVDEKNCLRDLTFLAFVCVQDDLRRETKEAVKTIKRAGVKMVMITGDNLKTAESVAKAAGILSEKDNKQHALLDHERIEAMTDEALGAILPDIRVVARAMPSDKSRLVRIARALGLVVGMTGDGLNDAPALKQADVGFAMGSGTDIAKEASDIVINDNNLASIVKAVLYGRTIFHAMRKFVLYQLTMNLCAVGVSILGPILGYECPITVIQVLWINMIMDTFAAIAFSGEPATMRYLLEPPRKKTEPILNRDTLTRILGLGLYTIIICVYFLCSERVADTFRMTEDNLAFLSGFFALFIFAGIVSAFQARTTRFNLFADILKNRMFLPIMFGIATVQVIMINFGGAVFRTIPLLFAEWGVVFLLAGSLLIFGRVLAFFLQKAEEKEQYAVENTGGKRANSEI